jgi:thioredoxin 2
MATNVEFDDRGVIVACSSCGKKNRLAYARLGDAVQCGQCKQPLKMPAEPIELHSSADFDYLIAQSSVPVVVDYWAPWCGPCRMVAPELQKVAARQAGQAIVVKVNTDELSDLGQRFRIQSIPTLAVFADGKEVARESGARPAPEIEAFIARARAAAPTRYKSFHLHLARRLHPSTIARVPSATSKGSRPTAARLTASRYLP